MGAAREGIIALVTGPPGAGKTTVVRAACELIVRQTQQRAVHLEFDDFVYGVNDPSGLLESRVQTGLQMAVAASRAGAASSGWLVLEGFFSPRHWLEHLQSHLPVLATFGLNAPRETCWARNEVRGDDDRLPEAVFEAVYGRLDVSPSDDLPDMRWLDTTLPLEPVAEQLATELILLASSRSSEARSL